VKDAGTFLPIAVETLGSLSDSAYRFFEDLGPQDQWSVWWQPRRVVYFPAAVALSVTIQRSNAALFRESFTQHDDPDF